MSGYNVHFVSAWYDKIQLTAKNGLQLSKYMK